MPLTLNVHPDARVEIDPVLMERANGSVQAAAGAVVVLGRPRHTTPRSRIVVQAAEGCEVHLTPRCFFNDLVIRVAGGGEPCGSPPIAPSTARNSPPSTEPRSSSGATACSAARSAR